MAHLIRQQLSDSMPDATGDCGDSDSQSTSFSWGGTGPLNQSGIDEVKGLSTHVARQYLSRMRKLEINTTATYGRRTSLSMLSPGGPGEIGICVEGRAEYRSGEQEQKTRAEDKSRDQEQRTGAEGRSGG